MALAYLIDPETPKNDGTFRPLTVLAKAGTVVWASPPAPLTLCTNHCAQEIAEAVIKALAPACPTRTLAGWGRRFRIAIQGTDPRSGRPFIWHMFHARPGGGASPAGDGWPTAGEGQAAGGIKFGSVEVTEVRFPLFFARHEFRPDSGGDGRYRGGVGSVLDLHVEITEPARANTAGDGTRHAPYGILGGRDGLPHRYRLRSRGRPDRVLKTKEVGVVVRPGDVFLVESGGGGGYGDPRRRAPEARAYDRENGFVTRRAGPPAAPRPGARIPSAAARTARAKTARPASRKAR
jgi:N-methylhydantoinase B